MLGSDQAAYCGSASELSLVPAGPLADHRAFLGSEKVHAHVRGARLLTTTILCKKGWICDLCSGFCLDKTRI